MVVPVLCLATCRGLCGAAAGASPRSSKRTPQAFACETTNSLTMWTDAKAEWWPSMMPPSHVQASKHVSRTLPIPEYEVRYSNLRVDVPACQLPG